MDSSSTPVLIEGECGSVPPGDSNMPGNNGICIEHDGDREDENGEDEEEEEDDVDFNPFLKTTPSREASSSLSSEIEGLDGDVVDSGAKVNTDDSAFISPFLEEILPSSDEARIEPESGTFHEHEPIPVTEDAICRRTRARYSLASFSLDELENFLQETDDEEDLHNVDDEEEYRKFLAAVLIGRDGDSINQQVNENIDDEEDDDNDADFELEIEEALESDLDDDPKDIIHERRYKARRNRSQKSSLNHNKNPVTLSNRPLRPVLPYVPFNERIQVPESPIPVNDGLIQGFTPHQMGQLYCMIHEHVQLLIQVYSICAMDPSRKHIASDVEKLMLDIMSTREQVLARRNVPHPSLCFFPPYVHTSVPDNNGVEGVSWVPYVSGPIHSILDVAPLGLAGKYIEDVSTAWQERQRIDVTEDNETRLKREPLFPLNNTCNSSSPSNDPMTKKTMAATLVEKVKTQSIIPVPIEISKLAFRFYTLFNPALYPYKPPPSSVANRVLFTDSEDELLALGMMQYNTDWKTIRQRLLPCKSTHQIFVRQKNRSSSKAPENPIKAVRRMKNSPLTPDEISRIEEGMKVYRLDWINVWRYYVPYRDPSLLPRQWRIATGTQKSYKSDETKKAKRREYDAIRRSVKPSSHNEEHSVTDNTGEGDNYTDREDEAYVHEAFLTDSRPIITSRNPHLTPVTAPTHIRPSSVIPRPYRARKTNNTHLVKLAPGLPPVNLPPSVRVMSQSAFKNYQGVGSRIRSEVEKSSSPAKLVEASNSSYSGISKVNSVLDERDESSLQMHPLLFQTPETNLPYYPLNRDSSFTFFSGNQPQLNLNLFSNFRHTDNNNKSLNPFDTNSSSSFDFHPLLRRNDDTQLHASFDDAALTRPCMNSSPRSPSLNPPSPYERNNELDLNMHPSSTSKKKKRVENRDVSTITPGFIETLSNTACTQGEMSNNEDAYTPVLIVNEENRSNVDYFGDQSYPGIVMEQEELSDSDEEIGENVEFECEEMADSEEEGFDSDHNLNLLNQVTQISVISGVDNVVTTTTQDGKEVNVCSPVKDPVPNSPAPARRSVRTRQSSGSTSKTPSNKITKSTKSRTTMQKHVVDMTEMPLDLPEKPRKRTCRRGGSSVSKGRSSKGLINDTDSQRSKHVNKDEHG